MVVNSVLKKVAPHVPVVSSAYGFIKICVRVSSASTLTGAVIQGCKGIIIDCTPPVIKYPALCAAALGCTIAGCATGDPNFFVGALECSKSILE